MRKWLVLLRNPSRLPSVASGTAHYDDVIMGAIASQITSLTIVYSTVYSDADQREHQSSASLAFVWGIYRGPVDSPHKWPVTRKMLPFHDVIMTWRKRRGMETLSVLLGTFPDSKVHETYLGPPGADRAQVGPMLAPWWPHEPCYQGCHQYLLTKAR